LRVPIVLAAAATFVTIYAPMSSASATRTYIFDGGAQHMVYKPRAWAAGGVGASARMENLNWTRWDAHRAIATGTAANNNCTPTCAGGTIIREAGRMVWSRPRTCKASNGKRYRFFTLVRYTAGSHITTFRFGSIGQYNCRRYPRRY
jgi:hypothetical protein